MNRTFTTAATAQDVSTWKSGLIERIGLLTEKALLLEQKVDLLDVSPIPGACEAWLRFLVSDAEFGQQTYIFTVARTAADEYHVFTPANFVARHEEIPGMPSGYSFDDQDSGWIDRFLLDLGGNCQVDGEIEIENALPRTHLAYWMQ